MHVITTRSGTRYELDQSGPVATITRLSEIPIMYALDVALDHEPVLEFEALTIDRPFRFRTQHGWFTSTPIVSVECREVTS